MRRPSTLWIVLAVGVMALGAGCGGDSGEPGSSGFEESGTQLSIVISPTESHNIDCFQNEDCDGDPDTIDPEPFTDHLAEAQFIGTTYYNPTDPTFDPESPEETGSGADIYLERYTIEYVPENPAAPPLRMREIFHTIFIPKPEDQDTPTELTDTGIVLVDLQTKREFREAIGGGNPIVADPSSWPVRYTAVYNFHGQDAFGHDVHVRVTTDVTFANFDNCE